jgi:hypothetical protein
MGPVHPATSVPYIRIYQLASILAFFSTDPEKYNNISMRTQHTRNPNCRSHSRALATREEHVVHQLLEAGVRAPAGPRRAHGGLPPLRRAAPHLLPFLPAHHLPYVTLHGLPPHVVADLHGHAPHPALVPAVGLLLREEGPAQHRHPGAQALQRRVPPGVRQEHAHRLVPQHRVLRAPARQQAAPLDRFQELRRQHGGIAAHEVRPDDPHEVVAAVGQPPRELHQLRVRHHRDAAVVDEHHGPGPPALQPGEAGDVLLPEVGAQRVELATLGHDLLGEKGERADGVDGRGGRDHVAHAVDRLMLELVEGVEEQSVRAGYLLRHLEGEVDHELVGVRRADEAWEVLEPGVLAQPGHAVHRRVQEPIRQLLLCISPKKYM